MNGFLCWQLSNTWQRLLTQALQPLDLTHVQYWLLEGVLELAMQYQVVSQTRLSESRGTDLMMTSKVCRTLERKGLMIRARHRQDTRAKSLAVTNSGKEILQQARPIVAKLEAQLFPEGIKTKTLSQTLSWLLLATMTNAGNAFN